MNDETLRLVAKFSELVRRPQRRSSMRRRTQSLITALLGKVVVDVATDPWNDPNVQSWLLRLANHSGAPDEVCDAARVLHDWIKP